MDEILESTVNFNLFFLYQSYLGLYLLHVFYSFLEFILNLCLIFQPDVEEIFILIWLNLHSIYLFW